MIFNRKYTNDGSNVTFDSSVFHMNKPKKYQCQQNINQKTKAQIELNVKNWPIESHDTDTCSRCRETCFLQCRRCGNFYCSMVCHKIDWRTTCFMGPVSHQENQHTKSEFKDIAIEVLAAKKKKGLHISEFGSSSESTLYNRPLQKLILNRSYPKNESCVILTAFRTSNMCYVRSANAYDVAAYKAVFRKIQQCGLEKQNLIEPPELSSYAMTMRQNGFYRVQIVPSKITNRYRVCFIDIGIFEFRSLKQLYKMNEELLALPCYVKLIRIHGVHYIKQLNSILNLNTYVDREFQIIWVKEAVEAKLFYWQTNKLLAHDIMDCINRIRSLIKDNKGTNNYKVSDDFKKEINESINGPNESIVKMSTYKGTKNYFLFKN